MNHLTPITQKQIDEVVDDVRAGCNDYLVLAMIGNRREAIHAAVAQGLIRETKPSYYELPKAHGVDLAAANVLRWLVKKVEPRLKFKGTSKRSGKRVFVGTKEFCIYAWAACLRKGIPATARKNGATGCWLLSIDNYRMSIGKVA